MVYGGGEGGMVVVRVVCGDEGGMVVAMVVYGGGEGGMVVVRVVWWWRWWYMVVARVVYGGGEGGMVVTKVVWWWRGWYGGHTRTTKTVRRPPQQPGGDRYPARRACARPSHYCRGCVDLPLLGRYVVGRSHTHTRMVVARVVWWW